MSLAPEVRAALALQARGLSPAAIERVLPLVGVQVLDGDAEVTTRIDALAADLPALFGATTAPGRPAPSAPGDDTSKTGAERTFLRMVVGGAVPGTPERRAEARERLTAMDAPGGDAA